MTVVQKVILAGAIMALIISAVFLQLYASRVRKAADKGDEEINNSFR